MAGCTTVPCKTDADCGTATCSNNLRNVSGFSCVEGACVPLTTECNETDACAQGSSGANCISKEEFPLPWTSCNGNSGVLKGTGINTFSPLDSTCSADCPKDYTCNMGTCLCEENKKKPQPPPLCPTPVFTNKYFDPPEIDYTFEQLLDILHDDPTYLKTLSSSIMGPKTINIPAYERTFEFSPDPAVVVYFPFPDTQFGIAPIGLGCANEYYVGDNALTIDLHWLYKSDVEQDYCAWGGVDSFQGVLTVCPEMVHAWFEEAFDMKLIDW